MQYVRVVTENLSDVLNIIDNAEYITYDTETTGLNVRKVDVIGISFAVDTETGYYLATKAFINDALVDLPEAVYELQVLEALKRKKLIMHNGSFDVRVTKSYFGVDLLDSLYCDTIVLKHTVDEQQPFGLKQIAVKLKDKLGLDSDKEANEEQIELRQSILANGGQVTKEQYDLYKADVEIIARYAAADAVLTYKIFNYYSAMLKAEGLEAFFYSDEVMPLLREVTIPMESRGIKLNMPQLEQYRSELSTDIAKLELEILSDLEPILAPFYSWYFNYNYPPKRTGEFAQSLCEWSQLPLPKLKSGRSSMTKKALEELNDNKYAQYLLGNGLLTDEEIHGVHQHIKANNYSTPIFNLSSSHHIGKLLIDCLGETSTIKTPTGRDKVDTDFLEEVKHKHSFIPKIIKYKKLMKLKSSYYDRFYESNEDGIFYPQFSQHRTVSGRYGGDLQQLPRKLEGENDPLIAKYTNEIRRLFIVRDGYKFIDSDYNSLEPHVFAHVSGEQSIKDIFVKGHDFYSTIAIMTEGLKDVSADKAAPNYLGAINKGKRQTAKSYSLGIPYGMESYKLSKELEIPQANADKLVKNYLNAFPSLTTWMRESENKAVQNGEIRSQAGRKINLKTLKAFWYNPIERQNLFNTKGQLVDSLELWKRFEGNPRLYETYKSKRKLAKNLLNLAKNFQIQSLAASITNRACISIARELKRCKIDGLIVSQVHDQIIVEINEKDAKRWLKTVQYIMENTYKISIPLKAPPQLSTNFQDGH